MKKVKGFNMTARDLGNNYKESLKNFVATDCAYKFMQTIKGTPAYWEKMLHDVLAMVKQLGVPSYFLTLSCADLHWKELVQIIKELRGETVEEKDLDNLDYVALTNELNSNPVILARHFQHPVEGFFKYIVMDGQLGKTKHYAIRVEFQD